MSASAMNQIQRDAVQRVLPDFRTSRYKGEGDGDISTAQLKPGFYLEKKFKGYTLPTFVELLRGLESLPQGPDARELTQCLVWFLNTRDTFSPRLELNILHTQALVRALRLSDKRTGTENLNRLALQQWRRDQGTFKSIPVTSLVGGNTHEADGEEQVTHDLEPRPTVTICQDTASLEMCIDISIRHVMTFPFLALHGVVAEGIKMGIDKAESRRTARQNITSSTMQANEVTLKQNYAPQRTPERQYKSASIDETTATPAPKRPRFLVDHNGTSTALTPQQPTVSPTTPRTSAVIHGTDQSVFHSRK